MDPNTSLIIGLSVGFGSFFILVVGVVIITAAVNGIVEVARKRQEAAGAQRI